MTVQMIVDRDSGRTFVLFAVSDIDDEHVSVVGSFNGWVPGTHMLAPQGDGTRTAFVEVEHPGDIHFRYLASGTRWFDDPTADIVNEHGSTLLRGDQPEPLAVEPDASPATPGEESPTEVSPTPAVTTSDAPVKKPAAKKTPAKKAASKAPATKAGAVEAPAKKTVAKKAAAKKSVETAPVKKTPAKKAAAKNAPAAAKKIAAKKATKKNSAT